MNVLITLPKGLIDKILCGYKKIEMRKSFPNDLKLGSDGFFVVEKGTQNVRCWCRVDYTESVYITTIESHNLSWNLCVSPEYIRAYARNGKPVWLWYIGRVRELNGITIKDLQLERNPQSFCYCPLSYGESF